MEGRVWLWDKGWVLVLAVFNPELCNRAAFILCLCLFPIALFLNWCLAKTCWWCRQVQTFHTNIFPVLPGVIFCVASCPSWTNPYCSQSNSQGHQGTRKILTALRDEGERLHFLAFYICVRNAPRVLKTWISLLQYPSEYNRITCCVVYKI